MYYFPQQQRRTYKPAPKQETVAIKVNKDKINLLNRNSDDLIAAKRRWIGSCEECK